MAGTFADSTVEQFGAYLSLSLLHGFNALSLVYLAHVEITLALGRRDLCCQLLLSDGVLVGCNMPITWLSDVLQIDKHNLEAAGIVDNPCLLAIQV